MTSFLSHTEIFLLLLIPPSSKQDADSYGTYESHTSTSIIYIKIHMLKYSYTLDSLVKKGPGGVSYRKSECLYITMKLGVKK